MKIIYGLFVAACLSLAACASGTTGDDVGASAVKDQAATQVLHYDSQDIAALPLGEFLHLDISNPNTVYSFEYSDPSELDHVMVHNGDLQYVLGEKTAPADKVADGQKHNALISAESALDPNIKVCDCPCCAIIGNTLVCC